MIDEREIVRRAVDQFPAPGPAFERLLRRQERKRRRQRAAAGVLGIAIAIAIAIAAGAGTLLRDRDETGDTGPTPTPPPAIEQPYPLIELRPGYQYVNFVTLEVTSMPASITSIRGATNFEVSPDGSKILFDNSGRGHRAALGPFQLYLADIDGAEVRQLTDDPVGASYPSWSPDGSRVVYIGDGQSAELTVLDLDAGTTTVLARGDYQYPSFSQDGDSILFTRSNGGYFWSRVDLWTIPVNGGSPSLLLADRGFSAFGLEDGTGSGEFSPDSSLLSYTWHERTRTGCGNPYQVAWISSADGTDPRLLAPEATANKRGSSASAGWSPDGTQIAISEYQAGVDCGWDEASLGIVVLDMETGGRTFVGYGHPIGWVDNHTLLVQGPTAS